MRRALLVSLCVLVIALVGQVALFVWPGPHEHDTTIFIPRGSSLQTVSDLLANKELLWAQSSFYWSARVLGAADELHAGEYRVPRQSSAADILQLLRNGLTLLHKITIPEGLTSAEVVSLLMNEPRLEGKIGQTPAEGSLLPETYLFARGDLRISLLQRMQDSQIVLMDSLMRTYDGSLPFQSRNDVIILASLVEEETGLAQERPLIAAVFLNRLRRGMRLQSDPTVVYGLTGGVPLGHALRQSELAQNSPYNTYLNSGLPQGPISNPGRASLEAVFHPASSDALYFVADGSGGHAFASTVSEHNKNVAHWRRIEKNRKPR